MDQWIQMGELPSFWNATLGTWAAILFGVAAVAGVGTFRLCVRASRKDGGPAAMDDAGFNGVGVAVAVVVVSLVVGICFGIGHVTKHNHAVADLVVTYVEQSEDVTALGSIRIWDGDTTFFGDGRSDRAADFDAITQDGERVSVHVDWPEPTELRTFRKDAQLPDSFQPFSVTIKPLGDA